MKIVDVLLLYLSLNWLNLYFWGMGIDIGLTVPLSGKFNIGKLFQMRKQTVIIFFIHYNYDGSIYHSFLRTFQKMGDFNCSQAIEFVWRLQPNITQYKRIPYISYIMQKEEEVVQALTKDLAFKGYPSLQLSTRDKFINKIKKLGYDNPDVIWVASEKIHGSNFSVHFNGQVARYGRRTDFLTKDIPVPCENPGQYFNQSFYDARNLVAKFHNTLSDIYDTIKNVDKGMLKFSIYGQYFGGNWPADHPNFIKGGSKHVQKGIYYTPEHQFFAFDIFIVTTEGAYWADVFDIPRFLKDNIRSVPIYVKGNFEEVFGVNIQIDSTIPELLGLPKLNKNLIEGMVIRPNKNVSTDLHERVIIKKKNAQFVQVASGPAQKKKQKKEEAEDPEVTPYVSELTKYLNNNRIDSAVSKFPQLKDRNKLKDIIVKDILTDAQKDELKWPEKEQKHKEVMKKLNNAVLKAVNSYFVKH